MLNLLFLIYDLERGGPEMRLLDFARQFPMDVRVNIFATSNRVSLLNQFRECNASVTVLPVKKSYLEIQKAFQIYSIMKRQGVFFVNTFELKELILAIIIKMKSRCRVKTIHHLVNLLHDYKSHHRLILKILLLFTDACICNSEQSRHILRELSVPEKKISVIRNGIDTTFFQRKDKSSATSLLRNFNIAPDDILLGTIANFRKVKNYPFLLKAFCALSKKYTNLRLICVGGGPDLRGMKNLAAEYGIIEKITFPGYSESVAEFLELMDIFVFCSMREGSPNVVLQAMSMEIPVVCSDIRGCSDIITNMENGVLFRPNSQFKFIECVEMLLNDKELAGRLGAEGRKTVEKKFSLHRMIDDYVAFYRDMAAVKTR